MEVSRQVGQMVRFGVSPYVEAESNTVRWRVSSWLYLHSILLPLAATYPEVRYSLPSRT